VEGRVSSPDTKLQQAVLDCLREHEPISGREITARISRRKADVYAALRRLEGRKQVRSSPEGWSRFPGGSQSVPLVRKRRNRPRINRYVRDAALEDIAARRVDRREWAARELERRRIRAACGSSAWIPAQVAELARVIAAELRQTPRELVDATTLTPLLGVSRDYIYETR
jgi:hypothetical protein